MLDWKNFSLEAVVQVVIYNRQGFLSIKSQVSLLEHLMVILGGFALSLQSCASKVLVINIKRFCHHYCITASHLRTGGDLRVLLTAVWNKISHWRPDGAYNKCFATDTE